MRNYKIHLDGLDRVDGVFEDWSFPRAFNLAADPKERFNIIWQNTWIGERIGPFVAAYQASVKKYPNLAAGQPTISRHATARKTPRRKRAPKACCTSSSRFGKSKRPRLGQRYDRTVDEA